jgi:protein gp37
MAIKSPIEWTNATWNPTVGCSKISPGCKNCYAEALHERLREMGKEKYSRPFSVLRPWESHLELPLRWKEPKMIFVNSMSDLFHKDVPLNYLKRVFAVMVQAKHHVFQVLTKRSDLLVQLSPQLPWPENIWMGVSIENQDCVYRARELSQVQASVRFLSVEPLIGPIDDLPLERIDWVIVGGESGPRFRPMKPEWARSVRDQCIGAKVPFFFKQWGGNRPTSGGNQLDGERWQEFPSAATVRRDPEPALAL